MLLDSSPCSSVHYQDPSLVWSVRPRLQNRMATNPPDFGSQCRPSISAGHDIQQSFSWTLIQCPACLTRIASSSRRQRRSLCWVLRLPSPHAHYDIDRRPLLDLLCMCSCVQPFDHCSAPAAACIGGSFTTTAAQPSLVVLLSSKIDRLVGHQAEHAHPSSRPAQDDAFKVQNA
jgi:hypothetical protein